MKFTENLGSRWEWKITDKKLTATISISKNLKIILKPIVCMQGTHKA